MLTSTDLAWSDLLYHFSGYDVRIFLYLSLVYGMSRGCGVSFKLSGFLYVLAWILQLRSCPVFSFAPLLLAVYLPVGLILFREKNPLVSRASSGGPTRSGSRRPLTAQKSDSSSECSSVPSSSLGNSSKDAKELDSHSRSNPALSSSKPTLSRRQRKNFRKKRMKAQQPLEEEEKEVVSSSATSSTYSSGSSDSGVCSGNNEEKKVEEDLLHYVPMSYGSFRQCKQFIKLGLTESDIYFNLLNYLLTPTQLSRLSYPGDHESINSSNKKSKKIDSDLNIAAKVFVPKTSPRGGNNTANNGSNLKTCVRCLSSFSLKDYDIDLSSRKKRNNVCRYHHGKVRVSKQFGHAYTCCGGPSDKPGCQTAPHHVWSDSSSAVSGRGYVKTKKSQSIPFGVYSLDCEMAFTTTGMELVKVTVISVDGSPIYESFVQPDSRIVDHNTRFSGVSAKDLDFNPTKTLKQVQNDLMRIISSDTILIGHALDNDFRALRLIHNKVVDTAVIFPHFYGIPYRRSLKSLAEIYLKRRIQTRETGHDPYEDALASVELILWKMRKDLDDGLSFFV